MTRWTLGIVFAAAFAGACLGGIVYVFGDRITRRLIDEAARRTATW